MKINKIIIFSFILLFFTLNSSFAVRSKIKKDEYSLYSINDNLELYYHSRRITETEIKRNEYYIKELQIELKQNLDAIDFLILFLNLFSKVETTAKEVYSFAANRSETNKALSEIEEQLGIDPSTSSSNYEQFEKAYDELKKGWAKEKAKEYENDKKYLIQECKDNIKKLQDNIEKDEEYLVKLNKTIEEVEEKQKEYQNILDNDKEIESSLLLRINTINKSIFDKNLAIAILKQQIKPDMECEAKQNILNKINALENEIENLEKELENLDKELSNGTSH